MRNILLKIRFFIYRKFFPEKLKNTSPREKDGFVLTFEDDFNEISWGEGKKWGVGEHWGDFHPNRPFVYFGEPEINEPSVADFFVKYKPKKFIFDGRELTLPFMASWLTTYNSFSQTHGRFECRMTLPKEKATWPAFWIYGPTWPPEIDIIEAYGKKTGKSVVRQEMNIHYSVGSRKKSIGAKKITIDDYDDEIEDRFHEFAVEWDPHKIIFYTDGIEIYRFTNNNVLKHVYGPQHVLVNHNIQPQYLSEDEYENYESKFRVDYVRIYKRK